MNENETKATETTNNNMTFDENGIPDQAFSDPFSDTESSVIDDLMGDLDDGAEYPAGEHIATVRNITLKPDDGKAYIGFVTDDETGCFEGVDNCNLIHPTGQKIFREKLKAIAKANGVDTAGMTKASQLFNLLSKMASDGGLMVKIVVTKRQYTGKDGDTKETNNYKVLGAVVPKSDPADGIPF